MTILDILKRVAPKISIAVPSTVFGSTVRENVELADVANEVAELISRAHDWQRLKRQWSMTGNGVTTGFDLPDDYDRMPKDQSMWSSDGITRLAGPIDHDLWLENQVRDWTPATPEWTILGGQFQFWPAIRDGEVVRTYYMGNEFAADEAGARKTLFTADTDVFRLDATLLRLGVVWKWKVGKGLPAEAEAAEFGGVMAQRVERDRGSRILRPGRPRMPSDVRTAYPWAITPE